MGPTSCTSRRRSVVSSAAAPSTLVWMPVFSSTTAAWVSGKTCSESSLDSCARTSSLAWASDPLSGSRSMTSSSTPTVYRRSGSAFQRAHSGKAKPESTGSSCRGPGLDGDTCGASPASAVRASPEPGDAFTGRDPPLAVRCRYRHRLELELLEVRPRVVLDGEARAVLQGHPPSQLAGNGHALKEARAVGEVRAKRR